MGNINWEYAIGIVGVIATVWGILYIIKPNLKYFIEILPFVNPRDVDKNIKSKLKITYDNQEVSQLSLARVTICNKGNAVAEKFSKPIVIKFSKKILSAIPNVENLKSGLVKGYKISNNNTQIELTPDFINAGESLSFDIISESIEKEDVGISGRCLGCSNIRQLKSRELSYKIVVAFGILTGLFVIFCYNYNKLVFENKMSQIEQKLTLLDDKIIKQYERLIEYENQRADTICTESEKMCAECKDLLLNEKR